VLFIYLVILFILAAIWQSSEIDEVDTAQDTATFSQLPTQSRPSAQVESIPTTRPSESGTQLVGNGRQAIGAPSAQAGAPRRKATPDPLVRQAQQILSDLGYDPGPIDGIAGNKTISAFSRFQSDYRFEVTGKIDRSTFDKLYELRPRLGSEPKSKPAAPGRATEANENELVGSSRTPAMSTAEPDQSESGSKYLAVGGTKDDVVRLQGRPQTQTVYSEIDEEVWNYPGGQVTFSIRTQRVTHLNNFGNGLKVAGHVNVSRNYSSQTQSGSNHLSIGSHKDDVLRLQGRPQNQTVYSEIDEEVWNYPGGQVTLSTHTQRVTHLNNFANGLRVYGHSKNPQNYPSQSQSSNNYFSIGSHKDDVLRLQGSPQTQTVYREIDEEVWNYPGGQVTFSTRTQRVTHFNNYANGLKVIKN
jgi:peptidoglycan hydrolase-like protein with peptidoglycan-binding domain